MRRKLLTPLLATALVVGCSSSGTSPNTDASIKIVTKTIGSNLDPDGYRVLITLASPHHIGINDSVVIDSLQFGDRTFTLDSVASNCAVDSATAQVYLFVGNANRHEFDVTCH